MASNLPPQTGQGPVKRTSFSAYPNNNVSILLDKAKMGVRGSTPDSEALVSSDDEPELLHRIQSLTSNPGLQPARKASWFAESQSSTRKPSLAATGPFSPISPGTMPSSVDLPPWTAGAPPATSSTIGKGHSSNSSFPWGNTIWNSEPQKAPPQRLTEVIPSPTTAIPSNPAAFNQEERTIRSPSLSRDMNDRGFPFSIPLQPTPKTYRSQSYSVGQIDPESNTAQAVFSSTSAYTGAKRAAPYLGAHNRSSRPGPLGENAHDTNPLGQLREVDDDEDNPHISNPGINRGDTRTLEDLAGENALLRQQLAANQMQSSRGLRSSLSSQRHPINDQYYHQRFQDSLRDDFPPYESEGPRSYEVAEPGGLLGRRFSEYGTSAGPHYALGMNPDHKGLEHAKRGQWQSSLGFARAEDPPQSRRHSFAEMPTRHNSLGSTNDDDIAKPLQDLALSPRASNDHPDDVSDRASRLSHGDPMRYFAHPDSSSRDFGDLQPLSSSSLHQHYLHGQIPRPQNYGPPQSRPSQLLYIVTFKCLRADVFYVQDGTGLRVKKGDLVIVEADRGTDLGTVQSDTLGWAEAKQLKEDYTKKHHEWLMAFSHHTQDGTVAGPNPNGASVAQTSPSPSANAGFQDLPSGEIKPKMIKRLAQPHEIATLREKEGGEAKAKRMCQQKVVDHRLNMEILDAEFQMDWKKLTFFYFADAYINFNPLVTDLFKIYKTRIWMSAINTAAIASPHGGPKPPSVPLRSALMRDYDEYRPGQYNQGSSTGPSQPLVSGLGGIYNGNRMVAFEPVYQQPIPPQGYEHRQVSPFPTEYRSPGQQATNIAPHFTPGNFVPPLHHTPSLGSSQDTSHVNPTNRQQEPHDWRPSFPGIPIGR